MDNRKLKAFFKTPEEKEEGSTLSRLKNQEKENDFPEQFDNELEEDFIFVRSMN